MICCTVYDMLTLRPDGVRLYRVRPTLNSQWDVLQ